MVQPDEEELLAGGAPRRVVRVGSTVRVAPHVRSGYIAELLQHLERVGFDGAPRWLGRTADGHELLSYVPGFVPHELPFNLSDTQLSAAGNLVLRFHDAVAGTSLCDGAETVCHGDLGPHNTVFRDGLPVAIIDWDDDVRPGSRAVDFADAVWGFADVTSDAVPLAEQARRVSIMCAAYPGMTADIVVRELRAQFARARHNHLFAGRTGPMQVFDSLIAWMDRNGATLAAYQ